MAQGGHHAVIDYQIGGIDVDIILCAADDGKVYLLAAAPSL